MTRFDMLDMLAQRAFGIADPNAHYSTDSDADRWRWLCDELVKAMNEYYACDLMEFIARMHDVDLTDEDGE